MKKCVGLSLLFIFFSFQLLAQNAFQVIVLGSGGGVTEHNISGYLVAPTNSLDFVVLDAGTLFGGLELAVDKDLFSPKVFEGNDKYTDAAFLLRSRLKAYILSHAHMDHIAGLVLASPFDTPKNIYCSEQTKNNMLNGVFKDGIWANFSDEGANAIGKYHFVNTPMNTWFSIPEPELKIKAFPLSHGGDGGSTAFLIESKDKYMLYFGDTGADQIEGGNLLFLVWQEIAPLVRNNKLNAIFIECAFPNEVADDKLFGHLNPKWLGEELNKLALLVHPDDSNDALKGLKIFITHIKSSYLKGVNDQGIIAKQLSEYSDLGIEFIIAEQAQKYTF